jgi:protein subunit release factor B
MEKKLLFSVSIKDCRVDTFRCPGKGGQNVNKVSSGVRITHEPSGASVSCCDTRDQLKNKRLAFRRMVESKEFQAWHRLKVAELTNGKTIDELVEETMCDENLKIEVRTSKGWEIVPATHTVGQKMGDEVV